MAEKKAVGQMDKHLFVYMTNKSGHSLKEAAKAMSMSQQTLSRKLSGEKEFKLGEMQAWMAFVGCDNAGPVFFPHQQAEAKLT